MGFVDFLLVTIIFVVELRIFPFTEQDEQDENNSYAKFLAQKTIEWDGKEIRMEDITCSLIDINDDGKTELLLHCVEANAISGSTPRQKLYSVSADGESYEAIWSSVDSYEEITNHNRNCFVTYRTKGNVTAISYYTIVATEEVKCIARKIIIDGLYEENPNDWEELTQIKCYLNENGMEAYTREEDAIDIEYFEKKIYHLGFLDSAENWRGTGICG